jgi:hypothetical protein
MFAQAVAQLIVSQRQRFRRFALVEATTGERCFKDCPLVGLNRST